MWSPFRLRLLYLFRFHSHPSGTLSALTRQGRRKRLSGSSGRLMVAAASNQLSGRRTHEISALTLIINHQSASDPVGADCQSVLFSRAALWALVICGAGKGACLLLQLWWLVSIYEYLVLIYVRRNGTQVVLRCQLEGAEIINSEIVHNLSSRCFTSLVMSSTKL